MTETEAGKAEGPSADDYALVAKAAAEVEAPDLPYRPPMPRNRGAPIALVGAGGISGAHLDAYARHGLNVVAICSRDLDRARARRDAYFPGARVTDDFDSLLRDPNVSVLDLTAHPDVRLDLMRRALNADKHVLSQKPFVEDLDDGRELVELAERRGLKLAVNQNGRWAPHLAYIREAVYAGLIGEVTGVHVEIRWNHGWIAGTPFEAMDDLILWDFGIHWFDFLASVIGDRAHLVHATTARAAGQTARPPAAGSGARSPLTAVRPRLFSTARPDMARAIRLRSSARRASSPARGPTSAISRSNSIPKRESPGRVSPAPGSTTASPAPWANSCAQSKTGGSR